MTRFVYVGIPTLYTMNKNLYSPRTKRIGLDWIGFWFTKPDWTGSGSLANGLGPDWILSNESVSYSAYDLPFKYATVNNSAKSCINVLLSGVCLLTRNKLFNTELTVGNFDPEMARSG